MSNRSLETLYLKLQCDYHLVQTPGARPSRAASVPALTPQGFAHWSTLILGAFPDNEARRLQDIVADLPLEAVPQGQGHGQGRDRGWGMRRPRERLPRRISRCLFPDQANPETLRLVLRSLSSLSDASASCSDRYKARPHGRGTDTITVEEDGGRRRSFTCTRPRFDGEQRGSEEGRRRYQYQYQYQHSQDVQDKGRGGERERRREPRDVAAKWWDPTRRQQYPPERRRDRSHRD